MDKDSKFTRDDEGYIAVRVVSGTEALPAVDKDYLFARDENGNIAMRVIGAGGGGGGSDQHNLGWYATQSALEEAHPTAEAGDWAIVGSTDTVWLWDTDNKKWVDSDQKGQVTSVNGQTGDVVLDLLPDQTGNAGKFLKTDGITASWENTTLSPAIAPTLVAANWSSNTQTITVQGVTANNTVIVGPIPTDAQDYADAGILCTGQALNSLTFTCVNVPATDLQVNIVIM